MLKNMVNKGAELSRVFGALADPSRRAMVERLVRGSASVGELAKPLDMSLAAVMQHVRVLTSSGVIRTEKVGRVRTCHLLPDSLASADGWIAAQQAAFWKASLRAIDVRLSESQEKEKTERKR